MGWQALAAGASIAGGLAGAFGARSANKQQRKAARLQANLTYEQRMEEIRRADLQRAYNYGRTKALAAASGVEQEGTPSTYLQYLDTEQRRQRRWSMTAATQERKAIREGAPGVSAGNLAAASALLSGIGQASTILSA